MKPEDLRKIADAIAKKITSSSMSPMPGCTSSESSGNYSCQEWNKCFGYYECGGQGQFECGEYGKPSSCYDIFNCYSNFDCYTLFECRDVYNA